MRFLISEVSEGPELKCSEMSSLNEVKERRFASCSHWSARHYVGSPERVGGSFVIYVIVCVTLTSAGLWNTPVRHTLNGSVWPVCAKSWPLMPDRMASDEFVYCWAHRTLHATSAEKRSCFLFGMWKVRRTSCCQSADLFTLFFSFRTFTMTTQRWSSTWTLQTAWWWRATCSRGPAMPSRPGTGKQDGGDVIGRRNRRWEVNQALVFQLSSGCYSWSGRVQFLSIP